ncbi:MULTISPECIES: sugar-transfer associated ATP-grasp domain-containing protein [Microbacterium]|uniref:Flagellar biosynthesis protein n=1 Tax=Microbacterium wangchenii TaxID=2541726 RepID=A0ABX5SUD3_9MICO|nr:MULTISPECIES: sugar-transfer associated ATP-grasp domain-containing protein [Microbacterium]MCK6065382.1 flagellar biosynthesis protein [Microbacterium sp. EYE_512]QBR88821.1 flagellar biosynthesis protein [Microbacterium wangchenii]TXK20546.1 flagellar biosynthesis protein [Microbacterium wangchenii]
MPGRGFALAPRVRYLIGRARRIDVGSVFDRAREASQQHGKWMPAVVVDMLWQAGFRNVGFQDYIDYDFAILTPAERATYMTHPVSNQISQKYDHPDYRHLFQDKIAFDRVFSEHLHREWMVVEDDNADAVRAFTERHGTIVTKEPVGQAGTGVHRYHAAEVEDWSTFHAGLRERGELLLEQVIQQHPDLAAVCPGTVNTTRVTAFFDGTTTHILAMAQKFGRGAVSDQMTFGGFYTMLDDDGHAVGAGYDSHGHVHEHHPDSGFRIADFQLPMMDEVRAFVDRVARVVPQVQYVGWDIVVTPTGPVLVEGNWGAGVYENKPSVTGIRTGHKPRYRAAIGF